MIWTVAERDEMRWLSWTVLIGVGVAVVLAMIGGMPVALPMPTHAVGLVDPTCGLTRASTALARADFVSAWRFNPAAFLIAALAAATAVRAVYGAATGRWVTVRVTWTKRTVIWVLVAVALWWTYQQTNAQFIMDTRYP